VVYENDWARITTNGSKQSPQHGVVWVIQIYWHRVDGETELFAPLCQNCNQRRATAFWNAIVNQKVNIDSWDAHLLSGTRKHQ